MSATAIKGYEVYDGEDGHQMQQTDETIRFMAGNNWGGGYFLYTSIFVDEYAWVPAVSVSTRPKTKQVNVQFNKN